MAKPKFRIERIANGKDSNGRTAHRGEAHMLIHCETEAMCETFSKKMNERWASSYGCCMEDSDLIEGGFSICWFVDIHDLDFFKDDYKDNRDIFIQELSQ